jgi:hypothetical protein
MKKYLFVFPFFTILLLIGCTRAQNSVSPVPGSQVSVTPGTAPATVMIQAVPTMSATPFVKTTATQTITPSPIPLTIDPTYLNFPSDTPTATLDPSLILMRIVAPGPMSKVVSPIEFIAHISPDYTGTTSIELVGEDGVDLYRKVFKTYSNIGYYTRVDEKIEYEINGAAEVARLQISTVDGNGRIKALNSVRVLLQAVGGNVFNPPYAVQDRTLLRYPNKADEISGGSVAVTGDFQPADDLPVFFELIDEEGNVLGSRMLQLGPSDDKYQQFTTDIPYQVTKKTPVILVIRQKDDRIDGLAYLYSIPLTLAP